jgi:Ca2+-binding EF-hand superfamily protein
MSTAVVEPEPADVAEVADADAAAAGLTGSAEEDRAATKLQALQRGKKGRAKVEAKKERVLVEKELKRAKKKFERMDKDGNGTLDSEEVQGLAHWVFASFHPGEESLGGGGAGKQLEDMVARLTKRLDKDGDGRLDFDEFAAWFTRMCEDIYQFRRRLAKQQEVAAAAKQQEVEEKAAARATRRKLRRRAIRLFQDIDVNNDGGLDRDEVLGMLKGDDALSSLMEAVDRSPVYVFEQLDADGDGNVTLAEFLSLVPEEEEEEQTPAPAEEEEEELEPSGAEVTEGMLREGLGDAGTSGNGASMVYLSLALAERELGFLGGLASLSQLQSLDLAGNQIVDSEMAHLDNMPYLLNLNLVIMAACMRARFVTPPR